MEQNTRNKNMTSAEQQVTQLILELSSSKEHLLLQGRIKVGTLFLLRHKLTSNKPLLIKRELMRRLFPELHETKIKLFTYQFRHEHGNTYIIITYAIKECEFSTQLKRVLEQYSYPE